MLDPYDCPRDFEKIEDVAREHIETEKTKSGEIIGLRTGYDNLDEFTGGFQPGELIVVSGFPHMGKNSFLINVALNVAVQQQNYNIGIFDGLQDLEADLGCKIILIPTDKSSRIYQRKINTVPGGIAIMTISGNAGHIIHNGVAGAGYAVKKGGFAHIGPAYNSNNRFHNINNSLYNTEYVSLLISP